MSKIEEALEKLQKETKALPRTIRASDGVKRRPAIPRKKSVEIYGDKHHLNQDQLVSRGLLAPMDHAIRVADEFRRIKRPLIDNLLASGLGSPDCMNVIMVTSAFPGAGKTFCSVNLAASISRERELSVLLIDGDVAKPHISETFGLTQKLGLIDILEDENMPVGSVLVRTDLNDLQVLPAGRKHAQSTELLASDHMAAVVHELATRYADRVIVIDSPPLLATSEAQAIARQAGQIALVVESGKTTEQEIAASLELLDPKKAINLILNKSFYRQMGGFYGGGYGSYGSDDQ